MKVDKIVSGLTVITTTVELHPRLLVTPQYLENRKGDAIGIVGNPIKGHPGAWWVTHDYGIAPYWYHEFEPAGDQPTKQENLRPIQDD